MAKRDLTELINIVKEKAKIEEVIGDYVQITRKGNSYQGICPFHQDQSPSMSVSPNKGIFKCFSCGAGGNVISFIQNHEGISFINALKKLSDKYEINWKEYINERKKTLINSDFIEIINANQVALNFYKYQLENNLRDSNLEISKYFKFRNLTKEDIPNFNLGFASLGNALVNFMKKKGFKESTLIKAGLAKDTDAGLKDFFVNRLLFALQDEEGNIIGFSGRQITNNERLPKYLNTAETKVFKKGEFLYNFHRARSPISLKKRIIFVEGYMDVISFSKLGVENVVATMGTTFSKIQSLITKKSSKNVTIAMDGDLAGINASISIGKSLYEIGVFNIDVFVHSKTKDIDELINGFETKIVLDTLEKSTVSFEEFYKNLILKQSKPNFEAIREFLRILSKKNDIMEVSLHINDISEHYGIDSRDIRTQYDEYIRTKKSIKQSSEHKVYEELKTIADENFIDIYAEDFEEQVYVEPIKDVSELSLRNDEFNLLSLASVNGAVWRAFEKDGYKPHSKEANDIFWALKKYYSPINVIVKDVDKIIENTITYKEWARVVISVDYSELGLSDIKIRLREFKTKCQEVLENINISIFKEKTKNFSKEERISMLKTKQNH